jgi:hypothetical protein
MIRLLEPTGTVAIILGASDWTKAGQSREQSYARSAGHFKRYMISDPPHGLGIEPDLVIDLFNDPSAPSTQLGRILEEVRNSISDRKETDHPIRDILIYYVGHGIPGLGGHLHFFVRDTSEGIEEQSSIAATNLAQVLRVAAPQQRRLVILDCCFSGSAVAAFGAQGAADHAIAAAALKDLAPEVPSRERGTVIFCSSPRSDVSFAPQEAVQTLFTGALLAVLRDGSVSRHAEMLSFSDLCEDVYDQMLLSPSNRIPPRPVLHQTDQQSGDLTRLPAFPNAAWERRKAEEEERAAEARLRAEEEKPRQAAEARRKAEEEQQAAEARRKAEEEQQAAEARLRVEEEERAGEAQRKAEEEARAAEAVRKAEEEQRAVEAVRKVEEEQQAAEARLRVEEEERAGEARRKAEEEERADEAERNHDL